MYTNPHTSNRDFGNLQGVSNAFCESRLVRFQAKNDADKFTARFDEDPRVNRMQRKAQAEFLDTHADHHIDQNRWTVSRLLGIDKLAQEGRRQDSEMVDSMTDANSSRIATALFTTNPLQLQEGLDNTLRNKEIIFDGEGSTSPGSIPPNEKRRYTFTVDFDKDYWKKFKSEEQIAKMLEDPMKLTPNGITAVPYTLHHFTKEQAKETAKVIMLRYTSRVLGMGLVSEANIGMAQSMLYKDPELIKVLHPEHHDTLEELKARYAISVQVHEVLSKIESISPDLNYQDTEKEIKDLKEDMEAISNGLPPAAPPPPTVSKSKFLKSPRIGYPTINSAIAQAAPATLATFEKKMESVINEQEKLDKALRYYLSIDDALVAVYKEIKNIPSATQPAGLTAVMDTAGTVKKAGLDKNQRPSSIVSILVKDFQLKKPEDYLKEIEKVSAHNGKHKEKEIVGAPAVMKIYKDSFQKETGIDDLGAKKAAARTFFVNELSKHENERLELEIDNAMGGDQTISGRLASAISSTAKGVVEGSDEMFICKLAESADVQIPTGKGEGAIHLPHQLAEASTFAGIGAGVGTGLLSAGLATGTALTEAGAIALTGGAALGAGLIVGAPVALGLGKLLKSWWNGVREAKGFEEKLYAFINWKIWPVGGAAAGAAVASAAYLGGALSLSGLGTALTATLGALTVPPVAAAAGIGALAWGLLKATGMDKKILGSRSIFGWLWPRWGARPAWGALRHDRVKLKTVWDGMWKGVREGKLSKTLYVRDQLREIGRLLLVSNAEEAGEQFAETEWTEEELGEFSMENKRREMQRTTNEMVHSGFGKKDADIAAAAERTEKFATENRAGWVRDSIRYVLGGEFLNWFTKKR